MGFLLDKYKEAKKGRIGKFAAAAASVPNDLGSIAFDISKNSATAKRIRKEVREEW